jgi:threonine dehydratase
MMVQIPDVDAILVPVGGAGLIAGISLAVKSVRPEVQVQAARSPLFASRALYAATTCCLHSGALHAAHGQKYAH